MHFFRKRNSRISDIGRFKFKCQKVENIFISLCNRLKISILKNNSGARFYTNGASSVWCKLVIRLIKTSHYRIWESVHWFTVTFFGLSVNFTLWKLTIEPSIHQLFTVNFTAKTFDCIFIFDILLPTWQHKLPVALWPSLNLFIFTFRTCQKIS